MPTASLDPTSQRTQLEAAAFVASDAVCLGDLQVDSDVSIWFGVVARGDTEALRIGPRTNLQDRVIVHADPGFPVQVGASVTVGHGAILHGCRVDDGAMIGMGSVVMNGAHVGARSLVGAGALLPQGKAYPAEHLILGSPARAVRPLTEAEIAGLARSAAHYVAAGHAYRAAGHDQRDSSAAAAC